MMGVSRSCIVAVAFVVGVGSGTAVAVPSLSWADLGLTKQVTGPPRSPKAAATCQGQTATIEGNTSKLVGTPGNDVIVAGGDVHHVLAGEGDDLICVVADRRRRLDVQAGPGADTVDTTAATGHTVAKMGTGADTFVGGPELDEVYLDPEPTEPTAVDVVNTGDGFDLLQAESAVDADLGPGDDFYIGEFTEGQGSSRVQLGQGHDTLRLDMGIAEHLRTTPPSRRSQEGVATLRLDLGTGTLLQDGVESVVAGQEEVIANGPNVWVQGTRGADDVASGGCKVTMHGGRGHDVLAQVNGFDVACETRRARLYGEGGPDTLQASAGNDVLIGGVGEDRAAGGGGRDRCVAEKTIACES
jgi:Ca2+-binding RTX toxin-like protein